MQKQNELRGSAPSSDDRAPKVINLEAGRRAFLTSAGFGIAGAAALGLSVGTAAPAKADDALDAQILNFALNLEYLEAEFYLRSVGKVLNTGDVDGQGTMGAVTGGRKVDFKDPVVAAYANEIAIDELLHVRFLRANLGNAKVARPAIDIGTSFTSAARAAGLIGDGETFDAYASDENFLLAAYIFEDVGVTAYKGAAPLITNKKYLGIAAGILAVEAYHAGLIRTVLYAKGFFDQTAKISTLRDNLDDGSATSKDQGVGSDQSTKADGRSTPGNIVPTDRFSVAFSRSPREVLNIVQGGQNATRGLFFPDGASTPFNVAS